MTATFKQHTSVIQIQLNSLNIHYKNAPQDVELSVKFEETVATANFNPSAGYHNFTMNSTTLDFEIIADGTNVVAIIQGKGINVSLSSLKTLSCEVESANIEVFSNPMKVVQHLTHGLITDSNELSNLKDVFLSLANVNMWIAVPLVLDEDTMTSWERPMGVNDYTPITRSGWKLSFEQSQFRWGSQSLCSHELKLSTNNCSLGCFSCLKGDIIQREVIAINGESELNHAIELSYMPSKDRLQVTLNCSKFQVGKSVS